MSTGTECNGMSHAVKQGLYTRITAPKTTRSQYSMTATALKTPLLHSYHILRPCRPAPFLATLLPPSPVNPEVPAPGAGPICCQLVHPHPFHMPAWPLPVPYPSAACYTAPGAAPCGWPPCVLPRPGHNGGQGGADAAVGGSQDVPGACGAGWATTSGCSAGGWGTHGQAQQRGCTCCRALHVEVVQLKVAPWKAGAGEGRRGVRPQKDMQGHCAVQQHAVAYEDMLHQQC